jgi:hypothetical protein
MIVHIISCTVQAAKYNGMALPDLNPKNRQVTPPNAKSYSRNRMAYTENAGR